MSAATITVAMIFRATLSPSPPSCVMTVAVASTAMIARNVSQPIDVSHETMPGTFCPCTPKAARESTMVGAEPRFPEIAMSPHSRNDTTMPMTETIVACQNEMPNPSTNEPYDIPNTDTFAANHGQNRSRGFAVRSDSGMTSMPARSISPGPAAIFSDMSPYWHCLGCAGRYALKKLSATRVRSCRSLTPASSRAECIERIGMPTSTVRMPRRVAVIGPIVEPQGTALFETNSCELTPACSHQPDQAALPTASVAYR